MLRKVLAGLTTLALALGMVALTAGPASAHHSTISATVECTSPNAATITWKVQNWNGGKIGKVDSSTGNVVPADTLFNSNETKYFTQDITTTGNYSLSVTMSWDNGSGGWNNTTTNVGSTYVDDAVFDDCSEVTPASPSFNNAECTGPGTYGQANYVIPTTMGVKYQVSINNGDYADMAAGQYFVNVGTKVKVRAVEIDPYELKGSDSQWQWEKTFQAPGCTVTVAPTPPSFSDAVCAAEGQVGQGSYTIPSTNGVQYWVSINDGNYVVKAANTYPVAAGTKVEIYADDLSGYDLQGDDDDWKWEDTIVGPSSSKCQVPTPPTAVHQQCTGPGTANQASYTIPTDTGIKYQKWDGDSWENISSGIKPVNSFPTTITIRAVATYSNIIVPGSVTEWTFTFTSAGDCLIEVTPAAVTPTYPVCVDAGESSEGGYTIPAIPTGVTYTVTINGAIPFTGTAGFHALNDGDVVSVVATAKNGYKLAAGSWAWGPWTMTDPGDCIVTVTPVVPTVTVITQCGEYGDIVLPTTTGVVYELTVGDGKQGAYTVTATPASGYEFVGDQVVEFKGNLGTYTECATPVEPKVTVIEVCGEYGKIELPSTEGVVYTLTSGDGQQGAYTVTATPAPGFSFVGEQSVEFKGNLGTHTECATPLAVTFEDGLCIVDSFGGQLPGTFTIPTKAGVQYSVSLDNGLNYTDYDAGTYDVVNGTTVKVMAKPLPMYTLEGTTEWSHFFPIEYCPPTLGVYDVELTFTNQVCTLAGGVAPGTVTVSSAPAGPADNPVPVTFFLNKGTASEQVITGTTQLPPGNYTVTAVKTLSTDGLVATPSSLVQPDGTVLWPVSIGAANALNCLELTTLAYTGTTLAMGGFALAGGLVVLGGIILVMRRREQQHSA